MKILYVGNERRAAGLAARALHGIAPDLAVTWAHTLGSALHWLFANRDAAAIIAEVDVQGQPSAPFLQHLRRRGVTTPIVVVSPEQGGAPPAVPAAGADGHVVAGPSFEADLARVVGEAIERRRTPPAVSAPKPANIGPSRDEAEQRIARAEEARQRAEQQHGTELAAAAARLAEVQAQHTASLAREARICTALQQRLLELEAALRNAEEQRASEAVGLADQLAKRHAEFTAGLAQAAQARDSLAARLSAATTALDEAQQARTAEAAAAAAHLARREAELGAALAEAVAARVALERTLADAESAHQQARYRAAADLAAAAEREATLDDQLSEESAARTALEQKLGAAEAARQEADHRHAAELTRAAMRLAEIQARYDTAIADHASARAALERQLNEAAAAVDRSRQERASEAAAAAARLARREAELSAALEQAAAEKTALERTLGDAESTYQQAAQQAAADLAAAKERQALLADRFAEEAAARATVEEKLGAAEAAHQQAEQRAAADLAAAADRQAALEQDLAGSRAESARARGRFLHVVSTHRRRARDQKVRLEAQLVRERAEAERRVAGRDQEIQELQQERRSLQRLLGTTQDQLQRLHRTVDEERQGHERARAASDAELQRLTAEYDQLRQSLDNLRTAFNTLEGIAGEHAVERARLDSVVAERDAQLSAQAASHRAAEQAAQAALAQIQEKLRVALETSGAEIARLQREMNALQHELDDTRSRAGALGREAERVPDLQTQLEASQRGRRRQFERAPYGLCHCERDGVITQVNHSLVRLLGYRRAADLVGGDLAATVFESPGDLRWLIEQAVNTGKTETVETTLKLKDRRRLVVRLQALAPATGPVEIVVEDITNVRALEQRLRQAQRMEAVGRLASEVAVTCDALLRDVIRDGEEWVTASATGIAERRQGELLLAEIRRAAAFLRQLSAYSTKQTTAVEPVSVQRVLTDLEPVLKRVVGDDIELALPKTSAALDVDVEAERVERILVNVASYARERMPHGGQVKFDLATTVVGSRFLARYPNVRPGAHVLITVTELRKAAHAGVALERPDVHAAAESEPSRSVDKPGVDLGALLELVGSCGGHLWMEAEPAGNLKLKIHLPKRASDDVADSTSSSARSERGGRLAKWLGINSTAPAGR